MNSPILNTVSAGLAADLADGEAFDTRMGALLLDAGKLTPEDFERVLRMQNETGIRFGEAAVRLGLVG